MDEDKLDKMMKFKREMQRLGLSPIKDEGYTSPLNDAVMKVKGAATSADLTPSKTVIKGVNEAIDTKGVQKLISGNSFADKIQSILKSRAASKTAGIAGDMVKKVPMIGGIVAGLGTLMTTGDASAATQAALPLVGDADDIGPDLNSLEGKLESGTITQDEMQKLLSRSK